MPLYLPPSSGSGIPASTVTTKGDLLVATGSATVVRKGVGADGTVLVAASGQSDGLQWRALTLSDVGGANVVTSALSTASKLTVDSVAPSSPTTNDVWVDTATVIASGAPLTAADIAAGTFPGGAYGFAGSTTAALTISVGGTATDTTYTDPGRPTSIYHGASRIVPSGTQNDQSGLLIRAPNSAWGVTGVDYSEGQAILYIDQNNDVRFRVDRYGGIGTTGSLHVGPGENNSGSYTATQAAWFQSQIANCIPIVADSYGDTDIMVGRRATSGVAPVNTVFRLRKDGTVDFGAEGLLVGVTGGSYLSHNAYFDGTNWRYKTTGAAMIWGLIDTYFGAFLAPSGAADAAITWSSPTPLLLSQTMATLAVPVKSPHFWNTGQTGATAQSRWIGGTTSGSPSTGTWQAGDHVFAQDGHLLICKTAGTPGSWADLREVVMATTVASGTALGDTPTVGTSPNAAREDHDHGTPSMATILAAGVPCPVGFSVAGTITTGVKKPKFIAPVNMTISGAYAVLDAGSGTTYRLVWTTAAGSPTNLATSSAVGSTSSSSTSYSQNISAGDWISLEVVAAGTGASDLAVTINLVTR